MLFGILGGQEMNANDDYHGEAIPSGAITPEIREAACYISCTLPAASLTQELIICMETTKIQMPGKCSNPFVE